MQRYSSRTLMDGLHATGSTFGRFVPCKGGTYHISDIACNSNLHPIPIVQL